MTKKSIPEVGLRHNATNCHEHNEDTLTKLNALLELALNSEPDKHSGRTWHGYLWVLSDLLAEIRLQS